jgi:putative DNA primase/helicase
MPTGQPWPDDPALSLVVLDLDVKHRPDLRGEIDDILADPVLGRTTWLARTPSGGAHVYILARKAISIVNLEDDAGPIGELRGGGGYVLVPPSVVDGKGYEWLSPLADDGLPEGRPLVVDDALEWALSLLREFGIAARLKGEERRAAYRILAERPAQVGERNIALFSFACALRRAGLGFQDILRHLQEMNADPSKVAVPLPHKELEHIVTSACRYEAGNGHTSPKTPPAEPLERELAEAASDLNHARIVAERLRGHICWVAAWGWLVYRDGVWRRDPEGATASRLAAEALSQHYLELAISTHDLERRRALLRQAIAAQARGRAENALHMARDLLRAEPADFDARPGLLCVKNGVVDLATAQLLPHSPDYRFTRQVAVAYDPEAAAPQWQTFLRQVFLGNDAIIGFVQRLLGMAILGRNRERAFAILQGSGKNGKSALTTALRLVLGDYCATTPVATFMRLGGEDAERASPELASLVGRRLVVAHEPEERVRLSAAFIKNVAGNDVLKARQLFHEPFEFQPDFLPILVTNHLPELPGTDQALWDRVLLVPFLWRVPDDQRVPGLGEQLAQEEGPGILRWLVQGAVAYLREGLRPPPEVQAATARFRAEADDLYRFFVEETEADPRASTPYKDIRQRYEEWCKGEGLTPTSDRRLSDALRALGYRRRKTMDGVIYDGVRLRGDGRPQPEGDHPMTDMNDMKDCPQKSPEHHDEGPNYGLNPSYRSYPSDDPWGNFEPEEDGPPAQEAGPPPQEEPPHPPQPCPRCRQAGMPGYYVCERGQEVTLLRVGIERERHVLRSRQAICFNFGLLRAIEPDFLVVSFSDGSWGWVTLATARKLGHEGEFGAERQLAVPLGVFTWEAAQGVLAQTPDKTPDMWAQNPGHKTPDIWPENSGQNPGHRETPDTWAENPGQNSGHRETLDTETPDKRAKNSGQKTPDKTSDTGGQNSGHGETPDTKTPDIKTSDMTRQNSGQGETPDNLCRACGKPLEKPRRGPPPRWCSEACRKRARVRGSEGRWLS